MALSVTTTTVTANNANTLTINKPSDVQVGDSLIIVANGLANSISSFFPTSTGFTQILTGDRTVSPRCRVAVLHRIADSSDVSASTYTIDLEGTNTQGAAAMLRVRGLGSGNPITASSSANDAQDLATWTLSSGAVSLARQNNQLLLMAGVMFGNANTATFSNYSITSTDTNPTWTEVFDTDYTTAAGANLEAFYCAYAISPDTSDITAWSVDVAGSTSGGADGLVGILAVMVEPLNATADISHLAITPTVQSVTGSNTANADISHLAITPSIENVTAKSSSDTTRWTEPTKEDTTWTNKEI